MAQVDLDEELCAAMDRVRDPALEPAVIASGFTRALQWGLTRVEFYGINRDLYEPQENGRSMSFILPVVEAGDLIDLAAVDSITQHLATRHGFGHALGADAIDRACWGLCALHLVERPLDWLRRQDRAVREMRRFIIATSRLQADPSQASAPDVDTSLPADFAYLFNLADARHLLADVREIYCETIEFTERVHAVLPPSQRDRVLVVQA